ncbi:MAG: LuxR family transcriptional regulator [Micromonosporaceae bacterium]|nr:LuxR family transcriptional regulator [Micromonosporaceae bacterium]
MTTPRYVVATGTAATVALRRLARAGWHTREGFALTDAGWDVAAQRLVLYGRVSDMDTAELAVHAAARGAGVVAIVEPAGEVGRALLADLSRLGPVIQDPEAEVEPHESADGDGGPVAVLLPEQRALLDRLANGETIAAAAAAEYLSLRTANRRIAQARDALGVRTTREAVLSYLRQRKPSA